MGLDLTIRTQSNFTTNDMQTPRSRIRSACFFLVFIWHEDDFLKPLVLLGYDGYDTYDA